MTQTLPSADRLMEKLQISLPIIGVYDAPDPGVFQPLVEPEPGKNACIYQYFPNWKEGKTLLLTKENSGCGGCAHWIFGKQTRTQSNFIKFLVDGEGLRETPELMSRWLDHEKPYKPIHPNILAGPLRADQVEYLKTVSFLVTPDQLCGLMIGAHYYSSPADIIPPVIAPFGSGCMELLPLFKDFDYPQALIGGKDIAMRHHIPPEIMVFTVTVPMYRLLCQLDEKSFLYKPFLENLIKSRGEKGIRCFSNNC